MVWVFQQGLPNDRKAKDLVAVQFTDLDVSAVPTGSPESCQSSVCRDTEEEGLNTVHRNRTGEPASETEGVRQRQSPLLHVLYLGCTRGVAEIWVSLSASII